MKSQECTIYHRLISEALMMLFLVTKWFYLPACEPLTGERNMTAYLKPYTTDGSSSFDLSTPFLHKIYGNKSILASNTKTVSHKKILYVCTCIDTHTRHLRSKGRGMGVLSIRNLYTEQAS